MKVFLTSLLVASLALASFANAVPLNETANVTSTHNGTYNGTYHGTFNGTSLDMSEAMAELLTAYKNVMPCGNATYNILPMAPFRKSSVKVNFTGENLSLNGHIENLVIAGLDDYLIVQLTTNSSNNRTEMDILHKDIHILGKFNLKIQADVAGFRYVQPLEGFISLQLLNLRVSSGMTLGPNEVGGIQLSNLEYSLQVGDIVVNNLNTEWSVAVNNFANQYVRDFSMLFLQTNRETFGKMYSEYVTLMGNKALYNVPYSALNSAFAEAIQLLKSMDCNL